MYSLSIVVTFHREGLIARKTLENLKEIISYSDKVAASWQKIEVIAILDNPDPLTTSSVKQFSTTLGLTEVVDYKNPSDSRNHGANLATGTFIFFMDGDDFFSTQALVAIFNTLAAHYKTGSSWSVSPAIEFEKHIAVFPATYIEFPKIYVQEFIESNPYLRQNMMFYHCFVARVCCLREIILLHPIQTNINSYGFEDWDLNNRLLALGMSFKIATGFEVYYRKKEIDSVLSHHLKSNCIVRYSPLYAQQPFSLVEDNLLVANHLPEIKVKSILAKFLYKLKRYLRHRDLKLPHLNPKFTRFADFLIARGETSLTVNEWGEGSYLGFAQKLSDECICFYQLRNFMQGADLVFFVPWVKMGGADRLLLEHIRILQNAGYAIKVVTNIELGERINQLNCEYYNIGNSNPAWAQLSEYNRQHVLIKALLASKVKATHIINSEPLLKLIKYYAAILHEHGVKSIVTFFGLDVDWSDDLRHIGFPAWYPEVYNNVEAVIGDNDYWYDEYKKINRGIDFKYIKLFSPISDSSKYTARAGRSISNKILWASRICNQKLFSIFYEIVLNCPDKMFIIYGGAPENKDLDQLLAKLKCLANVEFRGEYLTLEELDLNEFDIYLYTAMFDGIPTILLDMINNLLPTICSNVGGISEVVGLNYELLVANAQSVQEYIDKIRQFYTNISYFNLETERIKDGMLNFHNYEKFKNDYLAVMDLLK